MSWRATALWRRRRLSESCSGLYLGRGGEGRRGEGRGGEGRGGEGRGGEGRRGKERGECLCSKCNDCMCRYIQ